MKKSSQILIAVAALAFFNCSDSSTSANEDENKTSYNYKFIHYCQIRDTKVTDCEDVPSKNGSTLNIIGKLEKGNSIFFKYYLGTPSEGGLGNITEFYTFLGEDCDDFGCYDLFENNSDRFKIYGSTLAVYRSLEDEYYWSFSNDPAIH